MNKNEEHYLQRLRRLANKQGLTLKKSRAQTYNMDDQGGYMVIDTATNAIVYGEKFDLSLEDVEKYLSEE